MQLTGTDAVRSLGFSNGDKTVSRGSTSSIYFPVRARARIQLSQRESSVSSPYIRHGAIRFSPLPFPHPTQTGGGGAEAEGECIYIILAGGRLVISPSFSVSQRYGAA